MKIDKRFEIPFICSAGAVPWSKVWKNQRRATEVKLCSIPCLSLSTPAEEIKELSLCKVRSLWTSSLYVSSGLSRLALASDLSQTYFSNSPDLRSVCGLATSGASNFSLYIYILAWAWHKYNMICDTFLLSHCSAEDRFRQAKFLKVLIYLSDITTAS